MTFPETYWENLPFDPLLQGNDYVFAQDMEVTARARMVTKERLHGHLGAQVASHRGRMEILVQHRMSPDIG